MDQASFLGLRALGSRAVIQCVWVYNRPVDMDGLRRFHGSLQYGLMSRRVERSPLPFARDRWVYSPGAAEIYVAETPRPRTELIEWLDELARLPNDPEYGPSWHLAVLPLRDGGAAVALSTSHTIVDALALIEAVSDAGKNRARYLGYPHPRSRTRGQAVRQDAKQTIASLPELGRAAAATVRYARRSRAEVAASLGSPSSSIQANGDDVPVVVPSLAMFVDIEEWDSRAKSIGGNALTLGAAFACRLGVRMGRVRDDGTVNLSFPISTRTENDTRGNALVFPGASIDPTHLAKDLGEIRDKVKDALGDLSETTDELLAPLPLTSMTPKWLARRAALVGRGANELPVGFSAVLDMDPDTNRADGSDADYMFGRLVEDGITKGMLERMGGQLFVASTRVHGKVQTTITAYRPGGPNTPEALREDTLRTLEEFDLTAEIYS